MPGMIVNVINEMRHPAFAAGFIGYLIYDVAELRRLGQDFVNVGMLNRQKTRIIESCIGSHLPGSQAEAIDVVRFGVEALGEITMSFETFKQGQLNVYPSG